MALAAGYDNSNMKNCSESRLVEARKDSTCVNWIELRGHDFSLIEKKKISWLQLHQYGKKIETKASKFKIRNKNSNLRKKKCTNVTLTTKIFLFFFISWTDIRYDFEKKVIRNLG